MPHAVLLTLMVLANWRVSSLFAREDGPFNLFLKVRHFLGVRYDEYSDPYGTNVFSRGVICMWCNSVWFGLLIAVAYNPYSLSSYTLVPLALSAGAILVEDLRNGIQ